MNTSVVTTEEKTTERGCASNLPNLEIYLEQNITQLKDQIFKIPGTNDIRQFTFGFFNNSIVNPLEITTGAKWTDKNNSSYIVGDDYTAFATAGVFFINIPEGKTFYLDNSPYDISPDLKELNLLFDSDIASLDPGFPSITKVTGYTTDTFFDCTKTVESLPTSDSDGRKYTFECNCEPNDRYKDPRSDPLRLQARQFVNLRITPEPTIPNLRADK